MTQANSSSRSLIDQAPDAVIFADPEGIIREWNAAAARIFGYSAKEATESSLDIIVPERFRQAHWDGYFRALKAGETKYTGQSLPTRSERKDGTTIYVELTFAIVRGEDNSVVGALAFARDITERWHRERDQRARLKELEKRLGD
jgi:PAS domain S-box-containing protein